MRTILFILVLCALCFSATTSVRIYHQSGALSGLQKRQVGVQAAVDGDLGYRMWGGKDSAGNVTQWLSKDKQARVVTLRTDSVFSVRDTAKFMKADSNYTTGLKADRLYYGLLSGSKVSADTIQAVKLLNLGHLDYECFSSGDITFDSLENVFHFCSAGIIGSLNRTIFVQSTVPLCSNTVTETSLMGYDSTHTLDSLPARFFRKGKHLKFKIGGLYSTKATAAGNMILRMKLNTSVLCSTIVTLDNNEANQPWSIDGDVICVDTGATGTLRFSSSFNHSIAGVMHADPIFTIGTTINTNIKQRPDFTVQYGTADVANKIRSYQFDIVESH